MPIDIKLFNSIKSTEWQKRDEFEIIADCREFKITVKGKNGKEGIV